MLLSIEIAEKAIRVYLSFACLEERSHQLAPVMIQSFGEDAPIL